MPQRLIVLDDTDPSIQYSGQWFIDKGSTDGASFLGPTYNHTLHGTASNGSVSLSFEGALQSNMAILKVYVMYIQGILLELGAPMAVQIRPVVGIHTGSVLLTILVSARPT